MAEVVILAVTQPGPRTEWEIFELGRRVLLIDDRHRLHCWPDEGLLLALNGDREQVASTLDSIDIEWPDHLEILRDPGRRIEQRLLKG